MLFFVSNGFGIAHIYMKTPTFFDRQFIYCSSVPHSHSKWQQLLLLLLPLFPFLFFLATNKIFTIRFCETVSQQNIIYIEYETKFFVDFASLSGKSISKTLIRYQYILQRTLRTQSTNKIHFSFFRRSFLPFLHHFAFRCCVLLNGVVIVVYSAVFHQTTKHMQLSKQ